METYRSSWQQALMEKENPITSLSQAVIQLDLVTRNLKTVAEKSAEIREGFDQVRALLEDE